MSESDAAVIMMILLENQHTIHAESTCMNRADIMIPHAHTSEMS